MAEEFSALVQAIINGGREEAVLEAERLLSSGISVPQIVRDGLTAALVLLGPRCTSEDFNLLEIMLAGRAMLCVMDKVIKPRLLPGGELFAGQPAIVIGTIEGDIHDLGRHVLAVILTSAGYRVVDLGHDVPPETLVEQALAERAGAIGVSSLITVTTPTIRRIKGLCLERNLHNIRIVAGGAAVRQSSAEHLNVDYVAGDVFDGLKYFLKEVPLHGSA